MLGASLQHKLAVGVVWLLIAGVFIYFVSTIRRGAPAGSEVESAPNRRPYLDDEALEGRKLDKSLAWAMGLLGIIAIGLPLYWLHEPAQQRGGGWNRGEKWFTERAIAHGADLFAPPPPASDPGSRKAHFNCARCHGAKGEGGSTSYSIPIDPKNKNAGTRQVTWICPPLNTVALRFRDDEIRTVIVYGRQGTPMPPWGVSGGGPMNDQQIDDLITYLHSIALTPAKAKAQAAQYGVNGKELFDNYCARCHTQGWSYGEPQVPGGGGSLGFNLTNGSTLRRFPDISTQIDWVTNTAEFGKPYGVGGISHGIMPHFGDMLTPDQIQAIVDYERSL